MLENIRTCTEVHQIKQVEKRELMIKVETIGLDNIPLLEHSPSLLSLLSS